MALGAILRPLGALDGTAGSLIDELDRLAGLQDDTVGAFPETDVPDPATGGSRYSGYNDH